jgi:hypothetical protein
MKKLLVYTFGFILLSFSAYGQIPNNDFENWITNPAGIEDPENFNTTNAAYKSMDQITGTNHPASAVKVSPGYNSTFALKVQNVSATVAAPTDPLPGFACVVSGSNKNPGMAVTLKPSALTGYYKFAQGGPADNSDTACVMVTLSKWNTASNARETVGSGKYLISSNTSSFTFFNLSISYLNNTLPDSIQINILSSISKIKFAGTSLTIDDLGLGTVSGLNNSLAADKISIYPNPALTEINISNIPEEASFIEIRDFTGKKIQSASITSDIMNLKTDLLSPGMYIYSIIDKQGNLKYMDKVLIIEH